VFAPEDGRKSSLGTQSRTASESRRKRLIARRGELGALYPREENNLFSVGMCTTRGLEVLFKGDYVNIHDDNELLTFSVKQENEIYRMVFRVKSARSNIQANASISDLRV
jgi:hypothetical protein